MIYNKRDPYLPFLVENRNYNNKSKHIPFHYPRRKYSVAAEEFQSFSYTRQFNQVNFSQFPFNYEIRKKKKKIESTTKENSQGKFIYINLRRSGRKKKYYYYYYHYHYYKPVTVLHYTIRNVIKILRIEYFTSPRSTVNKIKRGGGGSGGENSSRATSISTFYERKEETLVR